MTLFYDSIGEGEPVLCADGWTTFFAQGFADLFPTVAAGRRLLAFHYRGSGNSTPVPGEEHSIAAYTRDALDILDREGLERAHIVGIGGMGACLAAELASVAPGRVGAVVLQQPWAVPDVSLRWQLECLRILREHSFEAYQKAAAVLCFPPEYLAANANDVLATGWAPMRDCTEAHLGYIQACIDFDITGRLGAITAPVLLVSGDSTDIMTSDRLFPPFLAELPQAETHVMAGTPHAFFVSPEQKQELDTVVGAFIARHPLAQGA